MPKQILRLTESDLHRIIKESVDKILREHTEADLEAAKKRLLAAKKKGKRDEILAASQEYQKIKEILGKANTVINPKSDWADKENEKKGIVKKTGLRRVMGTNDICKRREEGDWLLILFLMELYYC